MTPHHGLHGTISLPVSVQMYSCDHSVSRPDDRRVLAMRAERVCEEERHGACTQPTCTGAIDQRFLELSRAVRPLALYRPCVCARTGALRRLAPRGGRRPRRRDAARGRPVHWRVRSGIETLCLTDRPPGGERRPSSADRQSSSQHPGVVLRAPDPTGRGPRRRRLAATLEPGVDTRRRARVPPTHRS
jgi:hypothetical protein